MGAKWINFKKELDLHVQGMKDLKIKPFEGDLQES